MSETEPVKKVIRAEVDNLASRVLEMKNRQARLVTATCLDQGEKLELRYHFDVDGGLEDIRLQVAKGTAVPSITPIYLCALLIENELKDFFGVSFEHMAVDFGSKMLLHTEAATTPMRKVPGASYVVHERKRARCVDACPCGVDIPRYVRAIAEGQYLKAIEVVRERNPLPSVCGRVCFAPCETACRQSLETHPLAVRLLKRYAADRINFTGLDMSKKPSTGKRVAVVGAGPAGLSAAYYLAKAGHNVVIFEALSKPGGMLRVGIPDYRLPQDILDAEIATITGLGVTIKCDAKIESLEPLLREGYSAVFAAVGAHQDMTLGIPGEDQKGVHSCISFLCDVNLGKSTALGNKVAVIGGGNSAIDAARTALRAGSKEVTILYRRTRKEMPATPEEVEAALEEKIKIEFLIAPLKLVAKSDGLELTCQRMKLGEPDASGRAKPVPIEGSEFTLPLDAVVAAIGQKPLLPAGFNLPLSKWGTLVNDNTMIVSGKSNVFAGGDAARGPASVVAAIADGRIAAISIDKFLGGSGEVPEAVFDPGERVPRPRGENESKPRAHSPTLDVQGRVKGFGEVEKGFSEQIALAEARRCWACDWNE